MANTKTSIQSTKNYRLFEVNKNNRDLRLSSHGSLKRSMKKYGFLKSFPIVCHRNGSSKLVVDDGHHRLATAESLGLPVHYVVSADMFDIAEINSTAKSWSLRDYAEMFSRNGNENYAAILELADTYGLSLSAVMNVLNQNSSGNSLAFKQGRFQVGDKEAARPICEAFAKIVSLSRSMARREFVGALVMASKVEGFEFARLIGGAERRKELLSPFSTIDANLALIEELHNFGRKTMVSIRVPAMQAAKKARN